MSKKIFSGDSSKDFWRAIRKAQIDILYDYGIKAQKIEQQRDDLLEACKFSKTQIKKGSQKKALPILRAAIAKATRKA